jgi:hypothetical protein
MANRSKESNTQITKKSENSVEHRNNFKYFLTLVEVNFFFFTFDHNKKQKNEV